MLKKFFTCIMFAVISISPLICSAANSGKPTVAVIPFENQSPNKSVVLDGDLDRIRDDIGVDIEQTKKFNVVTRTQLDKIFAEFETEYGESKIFFDPSTINKIGKMLGAEYLILGTVNGYKSKKDSSYTAYLSVRMIKVETAEVFLSGRGEGKSKENMLEALRKSAEDSLNGKRGMLTMLRGGK